MRTRSHDTDTLIITLLHAGDARSIQLLYGYYYNRLINTLHRYGIAPADTDDLVQELFIALWEKRDHLHPTPPLYRYLKTAIIHRAHNYRRTHARSKQMHFADIESFLVQDMRLPDFILHRTDILRLWHRALNKLPAPLRKVVILHSTFSMRQRDIAKRLGISPKTAGKRFAKAMNVLRTLFKAYLTLMLFCCR